MALAVDPINPSILYAGTVGGIYKSTNAGATWALLPGAIRNASVLAIDPSRSATVYAGGGSSLGVFKSTDGGSTWTTINNGLPAVTFPSSLVINPSEPTTLYVGGSAGVFKSTDGGGSWTSANSGLPAAVPVKLAIDPLNPSTLYAGTSNAGVFKSTDGGTTWQPTGE